jgi:hypothetical protein
MTSLYRLAGVLLLFFLHACATPSTITTAADWPSTLPDRLVFERAWTQDRANGMVQSEEEYLLWVRRFYEGFNTVPGWLEMSAQVQDRVDAETAAREAPKLVNLGMRISREWAKDNAVRSIDSAAVAAWRGALLEAMYQNDLPGFLNRLDADVSGLIAGRLEGDVISLQRYYAVEDFDDFDANE